MKAKVVIRAKTMEDLNYIKGECKGTIWDAEVDAAEGAALVATGVADTEHIGIQPKGKSQVIITFEED